MISDARGGHVSPGVYTEIRDIQYSTKSLGITTLGVAGETLKGPAFQPISIASWDDFIDYFGGTSPIKFKGTNYPKYELPYVAKAYLEESKQLQVVRVLGLSGYWAGAAWVISAGLPKEGEKLDDECTAAEGQGKLPVAILRSKKSYAGDTTQQGICVESSEFPEDLVTNIEIMPYTGSVYGANCEIKGEAVPECNSCYGAYDCRGNIEINLGKFALKITYCDGTVTGDTGNEIIYNISMDPSDPDYIYKVFPEDPLMGTAPVYIEAVYDMALYKELYDGITTMMANNKEEWTADKKTGYVEVYEMPYKIEGLGPVPEGCNQEKDIDSGSTDDEDSGRTPCDYTPSGDTIDTEFRYWNFISTYRCAVTPWIVSEVKAASTKTIDVKKLFKVYTISDGNAANYQVKISIQRIRPIEGLFDLVVRDFYDSDNSQVVLEKFTNCSMTEGESSFIGLKVGTIDGSYPNKSKYIAIEFSSEEGVDDCVPCGFLGYPVPKYNTICGITMNYNTVYDNTVKPKRQYFGLNDEVLDYDILNYKGVDAYADGVGDADPEKLTNGFHLDAIITASQDVKEGEEAPIVQVDGQSGFTFTTVDPIQMNKFNRIPRILPTAYLDECLYKDVNLRKFTVYPYGGFDGWDINREHRTNTNEYRGNKYTIKKEGSGYYQKEIFRPIGGDYDLQLDPQISLNLPNIAITTDYYAYLAGYMQFANPEDVDINLFATPGINWYDQSLLSEDALDIIEDSEDGRGGDALYIMAAPQYDVDMMPYTADDVAMFLEETELDSPYACTYWPWVKYYDGSAKRYIDLPATKDVVRDMAATDNVSFPWFSPAGLTRGEVDCTKAYYKTTLLDEDTLYENMINPIKTFAVDGVKVWGNKTLYHQETPRNRINVSRLMIRVKKLVSQAARNLIFEQYDVTLEKQFRSVVEPILQDVKANRGIYDYRIVTESTEETRDQHILPAKILIKPTPALEYISISFVVYPESVEFDESL